jgi:cytoskeletal protein CcmA (bactofilin family)
VKLIGDQCINILKRDIEMIKNILKLLSSNNKSTVIVDGNRYEGNSLLITSDGAIIVDGEVKGQRSKSLNISIQSEHIDSLEVESGSIMVEGNVGKLKTTHGDVEVTGDVSGGVETVDGDVEISGNVTGDVTTTQGDIECRKIEGSASTVQGDIDKGFK